MAQQEASSQLIVVDVLRDSYVHSFSGRCLHNDSYRVTFIRVERKQETEYGDLSLVERTSATGPDTWQKTENGILS